MTQVAGQGKRGCMFYGCLVTGVAGLILVVGILVGLYYAKKMLKEFTSATAAPLPGVTLSAEELSNTKQRVEEFRKAISVDRPTDPLRLSADELNGLLGANEDLKRINEQFRLVIDGNTPKAQMTVPLDQLGLPVFRGRYLNGIADLDVGVNNGTLRVFVKQISVNGFPIPQAYLKEIQKQNLAKNLNDQPAVKAALQKLQEIRIENGGLLVVPKTAP